MTRRAGATALAAGVTSPWLSLATASAPAATNTSASVPRASAVRRRTQASVSVLLARISRSATAASFAVAGDRRLALRTYPGLSYLRVGRHEACDCRGGESRRHPLRFDDKIRVGDGLEAMTAGAKKLTREGGIGRHAPGRGRS